MSDVRTVEIAAPAQRVWEVLVDVPHWDRWMPGVKAGRLVSGQVGEPGFATEIDLGFWDGSITYTSTRLDAPRQLVLEGSQLGSAYRVRYDLDELDPATTRVSMDVDAGGLSAVMDFWGAYAKQLEKEGAALKEYVERG